MKRVIAILLLLMLANYLMSHGIEPDKFTHFTAITGLYILSDCVCEWTGAPRYIPFVLCIGVSIGKELNDPFFSWKDIYADGAGLTFGFAVRFADLKGW
jgi:hypothetical protein